MAHGRPRMSCSPSASATCASDSAPGRSCRVGVRQGGRAAPRPGGREGRENCSLAHWSRRDRPLHRCADSLAHGPLRPSNPPSTRLLVCVHQQQRVLQLLLGQDGVELVAADAYALHVAAVHHVDDGLGEGLGGKGALRGGAGGGGACKTLALRGHVASQVPAGNSAGRPAARAPPRLRVWVVAAPVGPYAGLAAQVPHLELYVLVGHGLHVEADGWRGREGGRGVEGSWCGARHQWVRATTSREGCHRDSQHLRGGGRALQVPARPRSRH